ncbi:hypothetical protein [Arthrobacter bambusae]|jgi:hypothetical protein|uniref:Uncharacterized protein n=1 Tax=Arthrobacter bambusae TaxID=1338426 RepID=A0AAW8DMU0_9MICC|nr:hypothetical protein [Arthrobacter bambusae]MDP9907700.1 hypothetical protein [Arthrobacter bambusae]MDQ0131638.1 hypothetical protein [Arthrobacter bambusae]MDQ0183050.1 hypothetical protein [Arthrobacter bambusae]MDQ0240463.1 hypothetical protein [Arthrobacter bambusae]
MTPNTPETDAGQEPEAQETIAPAAGVRSKLTDAQKEMLASKSRGGAGNGWQSTGKGHKPTQASGKLAKSEKKVRW